MPDIASTSPVGGPLQMGPNAHEAFRDELERLRANAGPGPRDKVIGLFGAALVIIGLAVILVAFSQASSMSDVRDQLEMVILSAFGTAVALVGVVVYAVMSAQRFMRFWLLRVIYEQRDLAVHNSVVVAGPDRNGTVEPATSLVGSNEGGY